MNESVFSQRPLAFYVLVKSLVAAKINVSEKAIILKCFYAPENGKCET
jgi:hypothetical protein